MIAITFEDLIFCKILTLYILLNLCSIEMMNDILFEIRHVLVSLATESM